MGSNEHRVRFHGRGGQGVVTAAQILAAAAHETGAFGLASPWFGPERRGAPVLAFARIGPRPPRDRSQIQDPDLVVVLEENLLEVLDVGAGMSPDGRLVVNSARDPTSLRMARETDAATVDATSIALEHTHQPAVNTAVLGAVVRATGLVPFEALQAAIRHVLSPRLNAAVVSQNVEAARAAHAATRLGRTGGGRTYPSVTRWLPTVEDLPPGLATEWRETPFGPVGPGSSVANRTGGWRVHRPVLDAAKCTDCQLCWLYCPDGSILRAGGKVVLRYEHCKGCGVCAAVCAPGAIRMVREGLEVMA